MIRPQLLAATALSSTIGFLVPGAAHAAEPVRDWSGFYAGVGIGLAASDSQADFSNIEFPDLFTAPGSVKLPSLNGDGSVRAGYNWQRGKFVYGLEADGSLLALTGSAAGDSYTITNSLNALLSLRARFGVTFDRLLVFGTAGVAAGESSFDADIGEVGPPHTPAFGHGIVTGYIIGAGGEYALTDKVSLTAGASYYALSPLHGTGVSDLGYATPYTADVRPRGAIFETGVNVRF